MLKRALGRLGWTMAALVLCVLDLLGWTLVSLALCVGTVAVLLCALTLIGYPA